ncbi:hypothetical protein K525DRAFT_269708 [Schizophyllum commune Loenen D]|nr:hypothetical protein K525DRAFT_269708 [Schizophyllum commune Loenen D]
MLRRRASSEAAPRGARSRTHKSRQSDTRMFISKREDKRLSQPPLLRPLFLVTKHFGEDEEGEQRSLDIVRERGTLDKASSGSVDLAIDTYDAQVDRLRTLHVPLPTFVTIRGTSVSSDCAAIIPPYRHATSHARIVKDVPGRVRGKPIDTERSISRTASYTTDSSYICIAYEAASDATYARVGIEDTEGSACYTEDACPSSSIASGPGCCPIACEEVAAMECEYGGAGVANEGDWGFTWES